MDRAYAQICNQEDSMKAKDLPWYPIVLVLLALAAAPAVSGHTKLEKSEPKDGAMLTTPPPSIQLWFDEKLDLAVSKIEVTGASGKVEVGPVHSMEEKSIMAMIPGKLTPGTYKVSWQTAGDDGHVQKGEFSFMVH
jgi:methionine-rich copper-binding protein CopC